MYAMVATRPNLAHVVGFVSWYVSKLVRKHWNQCKTYSRTYKESKIYRWHSDQTIRSDSKASTTPTTPAIPTIKSRHEAIYSLMVATPYNGGQNCKSAWPCQPQRLNTQLHQRQLRKTSSFIDYRPIFWQQAESTIQCQSSIATLRVQYTSSRIWYIMLR